MTRQLARWLAPALRHMIAPETPLHDFRAEVSSGDRGDRGDQLFMACATWFLLICLFGAGMIVFALGATLLPSL